jgi:nicotinate-nucleotide pyrophosphorylase (carboxylating)
VLCGAPFFEEIFKQLGCTVEWKIKEGTAIKVEKGKRVEVATVKGQVRKILVGERTSLNVVAR